MRAPCGHGTTLSCRRCLVRRLMRAGATPSCPCVAMASRRGMTLSGMACVAQLRWMQLWCVTPVALWAALCLRRSSVSQLLTPPCPVTLRLLGVCVTMCLLVCQLLRATSCVGWRVTELLVSGSWTLVVSRRCRRCLWGLTASATSLMCVLWRVSTTLTWLRWIVGTLVRLTAPWVRCQRLAAPCTLRATPTCPARRLVVTLRCAMLAQSTMCVCGRLCRRCW